MVLQSKLFTDDGPGKEVLRRCAAENAGHLQKGGPNVPGLQDAVTRVQTALSRLGFDTTDPAGVYGQSTKDAVLAFKGPPRNILGPGQTEPDGIVGIQTIHRLDFEVQQGVPGREIERTTPFTVVPFTESSPFLISQKLDDRNSDDLDSTARPPKKGLAKSGLDQIGVARALGGLLRERGFRLELSTGGEGLGVTMAQTFITNPQVGVIAFDNDSPLSKAVRSPAMALD